MTRLLFLALVILSGCASVGSKEISVACGAAVVAKLIVLHSPWVIVPVIYTVGEATGKVGTDAGSAIINCGGAAMAYYP